MLAPFALDVFDPLATPELTIVICARFERQPTIPLHPELPRFDGSGLYGIYYMGHDHPLYGPLASYKIPVYVGQALSHNSATGRSTNTRCPLWSRVRDHSRSIEGSDLNPEDFAVRLLGLPDVHADLGENGLRVGYRPVWNSVLNGFGSHEQGATTRQSTRSKWDTVHAGRRRSHGGTRFDPEQLRHEARAHIALQIQTYEQLPWHFVEDRVSAKRP